MLIDFHIHAYADEIADRAVQKLRDTANCEVYTNGRIDDTKDKLRQWGIDYGVLLPVATKPTQQTTINNWAISQQKDNILAFGTVHPDSEDVQSELERIAESGLHGVKLHPDYQGHFMFEPCMQEIYKKCGELGLPVIIHMGYDPVSDMTYHAMPCDLAEMAEKYPDCTFIGAHMGGMGNWERVLHYVKDCGNIYFDTAFCAKYMPDEMFMRMFEAYGEDRILFASDLPWSNPNDEIAMISRMPISDTAKEKIFYKNAARLLKLNLI